MARKNKTNFIESVLVTLKAIVVGIITYSGYWILKLVAPDRPAFVAVYALFNLWFWGFLANRFWKWR